MYLGIISQKPPPIEFDSRCQMRLLPVTGTAPHFFAAEPALVPYGTLRIVLIRGTHLPLIVDVLFIL
jgi:hypothetical protein